MGACQSRVSHAIIAAIEKRQVLLIENKMSNYFFIVFLITIVAVRVLIFLHPVPAPTIGKFRTHHYMFGIIGVILGLLFNSILIYAIGLGLFVDELTYLLMRGKSHEDNYSKTSLLGTLLFIIIVFLLKDYLLFFM
jgi:hypothetical protein